MTESSKREDISKILWANAQVNKIHFEKNEYAPTNRGHGPYVKTIGEDVLYDLRLSKERPFLGHSHPLVIQHNFKALTNPLEMHQYSVPKTEYIRIIETFQKVHFTEILKDGFKITYHNIVINIDEEILSYDKQEVTQVLAKLVSDNPKTFFWLIEKDLILFSDNNIFNFQDLMNSDHVHLCLDFHFVSSVFIYSHHLFSEDENIQLFLAIKKLYNQVMALDIEGKNAIDYKVIDQFITNQEKGQFSRDGRYITVQKKISSQNLNLNGIISSEGINSEKSIFAIPLACTHSEVEDILQRISKSLQG